VNRHRRWGLLLTVYFVGKVWIERSLANPCAFEAYLYKGEYFIALGRIRIVYTPPCWNPPSPSIDDDNRKGSAKG
jgi:hypothetical protein